MKFSIRTLFAATILLSADTAFSHEEEVIDGIKVVKYPTSGVIKEMIFPRDASAIGKIPAHMQYIVGLDQGGSIVSSTGLKIADPEYTITLSSGNFKSKWTWWGTMRAEQTINRCYGGGWSFFDVYSQEWDANTGLSGTGRDFFSKLNINERNDACSLVFKWDEDMTVAEIKGYWKAALGPFLGDASGAVVSLSDVTTRLTIELQLYWEWKFGGGDYGNPQLLRNSERTWNSIVGVKGGR